MRSLRLMLSYRRVLATLAAYTLREGIGNRLVWLVAIDLILGFSLAEFIAEVAITERGGFQAAFLGAFLRLSAVLILTFFVVSSTLRELNEKGVHLVLSLPVPRWVYLFGKLWGFCAIGGAVALACTALVALYAPPGQAALWGVSLALELSIVVALSLLCLLTFRHTTPALFAVLGFYVASRSIESLVLMADGPFSGADTPGQRFIDAFLQGLAFVLPSLANFGDSDWLVYHTGAWSTLGPILAESLIYVLLLVTAALFDLYRKSF